MVKQVPLKTKPKNTPLVFLPISYYPIYLYHFTTKLSKKLSTLLIVFAIAADLDFF